MKIGFVIDDTLDSTDGVQQYVLLLGAWLRNQGHQVHYLTTQSHRKDTDNLHSLGKQFRVRFNRNDVPLALPTSPRKIAAVLNEQQFDVLHVQMPYGPAFGARVVSLAAPSTAVVGTFHIAPYSLTEKTLSKLLGYWLKTTKLRFDAVMSVSPPAQQLARQSFGLESSIVPNMVDIRSYKLANKLNNHSPVRFIFVGRLVARKGCEHFIKSLARLNIPFLATIVGDGDQREKLQKLVQKLNLNEVVTFTGYVDESEKRRLLARADIAVFPATGGESFGIVLIEAMAAGSCVVLAGDNPGYSSVVGTVPDSLIDPFDHIAFAAKLESLVNDPAKALKLYKAQQSLVKNYDLAVVAPQILTVYRRAIALRTRKSHTKR